MGDGTAWYKAKPTSQAVTNSEYTDASLNTGAYWYYWLRDSYAAYSYYGRYVNTTGTVGGDSAYYGLGGVRPACILSSSSMTLDESSGADESEAYTILSFN